MPAPVIPRKRLVSGNRSIRQLADKSVNADPPIHGLVPVIVVLVLSQQAIIRADIAFQPRLLAPVLCTIMPLGVILRPAL